MNSFASISNRIILALVVTFSIVLFGAYIVDWAFSLGSPYASTYEGPMLLMADMLASGQNIYSADSLTREPWVVTIYPPLYPAIASVLLLAFGKSFFALRLLSMISCVLSTFLVYRIFRLSACTQRSALTATAFFFSFSVIFSWSYTARPDSLVTFLSLLLLERFVSSAQNWENLSLKHSLSIVIMSWLAVMAKQQAIVFIIAIFLFLCASKKFKLAFQYLAVWLLLLLASVVLLQALTGGFLAHLTFLANVKAVSEVYIQNLGAFGLDWLKVILALILVPIGIILLKKSHPLKTLPLLLFIISVGVSFFSMSIPASNVNHLIPAIFALSWLIAMSLDVMPGWVICIVLAASSVSLITITENARFGPQLLPHAHKSAMELQQYKLEGKPVLTDDPYLNYLTKSKPVFEDCATFLNVWANKAELSEQMMEGIRSKRYAAIIINSNDAAGKDGPNWWSPTIVAEIKRNYKKQADLFCSGWPMDLYLPQ